MKQKYFIEYVDYYVNPYIQVSKSQNAILQCMIKNVDNTLSFKNISKIAKKLNTTIQSVKNRFTRMLNLGILKPINSNFRGEGVYLIKFKYGNVYKIGHAKNIQNRMKQLQIALQPFNLIGIYCKPQYNKLGMFTLNARQIEKIFKDKFAIFNAKKDIFDRSEFYNFKKDELVKAVKTLDCLHLDWAKSFNVLTIDYKHKGSETYKEVSLSNARTSILNCKMFD